MLNLAALELKVLKSVNPQIGQGKAKEIRDIQAKFESIVKRDHRLENDLKELEEKLNSL